MSLLSTLRQILVGWDIPPKPLNPRVPPEVVDSLRARTLDGVAEGTNQTRKQKAVDYAETKAHVMKTLMTKEEKEDYIAKALKCPNCGATEFDEVGDNAALTLKCDCGLIFNFMPQLRHVDIVRDPLCLSKK